MSTAAVLFDLDGVLVDSVEAWFAVVNDAARRYGCPPVDFARYRASYGQSTEADAAEFFGGRDPAEVDAFYAARFPAHASLVRVDPRAGPLLDALRARGVKSAVVTNTVAPLARDVVGASGLLPDAIAGAGDAPRPKPAPDLVLLACRRLEVAPANALYVGDSRFDREAATAAGVRFVGLRTDGDVRIRSLDELLGLVE